MRRALAIAALLATLPVAALAQFVGPSNQSIAASVNSGQVFFAGSTSTVVGIGTNLRFLITNPAGSGKNCYVFEIDTYSSTVSFGRVFTNPTANLPTTARPANNNFINSVVMPACSITADTGAAMSGGTNTGYDIAMPTGFITPPPGIPPWVVPPGASFGISIPVNVAATININADWRESAP